MVNPIVGWVGPCYSTHMLYQRRVIEFYISSIPQFNNYGTLLCANCLNESGGYFLPHLLRGLSLVVENHFCWGLPKYLCYARGTIKPID